MSPEPQNMTLFENIVFIDQIKIRLYWTRVDPNSKLLSGGGR